MPNLWMPGAQRLDLGNHGAMDGGPAKAAAHITWDRNASARNPAPLVPYERLREYFSKNPDGKQVAPHILWDPFTGRVCQFFPANSRSLSLRDLAGGTRTNRAGSVVLQIEALFFPYCEVDGRVYAKLADTPCKGWPELQAWVKSWGVPNAWVMGRPDGFKSRRSAAAWSGSSGWYAHGDIPENDHTDPGSWPAFVGGGQTPRYEPFPGAGFFMSGDRPALGKVSPIFTAMGKRLVAVGCGRYKVGPGPKLGQADVESYEAWQRKCGYKGAAAQWPPGPTTWNKLQVPNV